MKKCGKCNTEKNFSEFREYKSGKFRSECRECEVRQGKMKKEAHKVAGKNPGICSCCKKKTTDLVVDHCHDTGRFRGWLCRNCNTGLGKLGDNIDSLCRAMNYLLLEFQEDEHFIDGEGI